MVRAVILVKSPKKLIAARLRKINKINEAINVVMLATEIQKIPGVERTETMVEVNP